MLSPEKTGLALWVGVGPEDKLLHEACNWCHKEGRKVVPLCHSLHRVLEG